MLLSYRLSYIIIINYARAFSKSTTGRMNIIYKTLHYTTYLPIIILKKVLLTYKLLFYIVSVQFYALFVTRYLRVF